jgi:predicted Zn-dependent protease
VTGSATNLARRFIFFAIHYSEGERMKLWLVIALIFSAAQMSPAQTLPTVKDAELSDHLTRLADDIAARTHSRFSGTVTVLASDSINAYTLPSGELYVTRGLLKAVYNEAEIVFVLAQQLSSLQLHRQPPPHSSPPPVKPPDTGHKILVGLVSGALIAVGGPLGARVGVMIIAQEIGHRGSARRIYLQTAPASFLTDADRSAVEYLHEAGYDPEAALTVLEKLRAIRPKNYVRQSELPAPPVTFVERMRLVRHRIAKLERKDEYLMDSSTFKALKDRLGTSSNPTDANQLQLKRKSLTSSSQQR